MKQVLSILADVLATFFLMVLAGSLVFLGYYTLIYNELPQWF